ncbi:MAG TPA: helix-turn-helix domain-containing protein [Bacteroidia bacterium]|nr:helix-turn-helix domain-containing protein [Bacteroidia bacterium]
MPGKPDKFSLREKQLVGYYKKGDSQKLIADALGISVYTVNTETQRLYNKAGVHSVTQMLNYADRHPDEFGLPPSDSE